MTTGSPCPHRSSSSVQPYPSDTYLGYVVRRYGKKIDLVSQPLGGLHCGNVGVNQQCLDVFLLQGLDRLGRKMACQPRLQKQDCKQSQAGTALPLLPVFLVPNNQLLLLRTSPICTVPRPPPFPPTTNAEASAFLFNKRAHS